MKNKTKKELALEAKIKAANDKFRAASKAEKRMLVAQDAINRAKSGQYNPTSGEWTSINWNYSNPQVESLEERDDLDEGKSLRTALHDNTVNCECCALGGIMTSCVAFKNRLTIEEADRVLDFGDINRGEFDHTGIKNLFGIKQLCLIENAFEKGEGYFYGKDVSGLSRESINKAIDFGEKYSSEKDRFLAIMQNIVDNNGTFTP